MEPLSILGIIIKLGVPIFVMSWLLFSWMYREGKIEKKADRKTTAGTIKEMKKASKEKGAVKQNYIYDKWMWFGSGFYGLAALWTLAVMELIDLFNIVFNFPGFASLLVGGIVDSIIRILLNQLGNIVSAFVWFNYWDGSPLIVFVVAYLAYLGGIEFAKRFNLQLPKKLSN